MTAVNYRRRQSAQAKGWSEASLHCVPENYESSRSLFARYLLLFTLLRLSAFLVLLFVVRLPLTLPPIRFLRSSAPRPTLQFFHGVVFIPVALSILPDRLVSNQAHKDRVRPLPSETTPKEWYVYVATPCRRRCRDCRPRWDCWLGMVTGGF